MSAALFYILVQSLVTGAVSLEADVTDVSPQISYWIPGQDLTPELALKAYRENRFNPATGKVPNLGFVEQSAWFAVDIIAPVEHTEYIANIGYAVLDSVQFWVVGDQGPEQFQHAGDMQPFQNRAQAHRTINFLVKPAAGQPTTLLFKVDSNTSVSLGVKVYLPKSFGEHVAAENLIQGIYFGIILVMIIFNGFLYFSMKDKTYFLYVGFLVGYIFFQSSINGYTYQYLLDFSPWLNEKLLLIGGLLSISFMAFFNSSFLELGHSNPKLKRLLDGVGSCGLIATLLALALPYRPMSKLLVATTMLTVLLAIFVASLRLHQGYRPARIFLLAWSAFMLGAILLSLRTAGFLPTNFITEYSIQIGSALEVILLTIALGDRMNLVHKERDAANDAALQSYRLLGEEVGKRDLLEKNNQNLAQEINAATEKLVQADKLATLGQLVAGVAHDIANPTSYIRSSQEIIGDEVSKVENIFNLIFSGNDSDEAKQVRDKLETHLKSIQTGLSDIKVGSDRITEIHQAIRNQSRVDKEPTVGVDVRSVLNEAITMVRTKLLSIQVKIRDHDVPAITCRRSQIGQVLMNLISNAADAVIEHHENLAKADNVKSKALIEMTLMSVPQRNIEGIAIRIEDNGPGIPEEKRQQVRETFFTTKPAGIGTGLGLSICEKIIGLHQGELLIGDSIEFGGASMTVWLPLNPAPIAEPPN